MSTSIYFVFLVTFAPPVLFLRHSPVPRNMCHFSAMFDRFYSGGSTSLSTAYSVYVHPTVTPVLCTFCSFAFQ